MLAEQNKVRDNATKIIVICADDFAQTPAVTSGILKLLEKRKINATSCLVNSEYWEASALKLKAIYTQDMQVGLHLNLTEGRPLTNIFGLKKNGLFIGLNSVLIKAFTCCLNRNQVYDELKAQLERFITVWGKNPDFIDGHQHVHHLPVVRNVLLKLYQEFKLSVHQTYIRSVANMVGVSGLKPKIIVATGAKKLEVKLNKAGIPHNSSFSGAYDFEGADDFKEVFEKSLATITDRGLIMCHPGEASEQYSDVLAESRPRELDYFLSDGFVEALKLHAVSLS